MTAATSTADEQVILSALARRRSTGYRYLKTLVGHDANRALTAIDALLREGSIERVMYAGDTNYRLVP